MKKLMTLIGAAAMAFGLYAVDPYESTITFDAAPLGAFDLNATESGGRLLWWAADTNDIAATVTAYDPVIPGNLNYLALETGTDPLFRTAAAVSVNESVKTPQQVDIGEGVVFNQRVKFSAFDSDPTDLDENAKIAVWLKAVDAEDGAPETNLYVSTAILDSETLEVVTRTNLVLLGANVEPDSWHQLTITAIPAYDLGDPDGIVPGFAIAVDGNVLSVAETLLPASIGDVYPTIGAAKLIAEKKLMPSRVRFDISQTLIGAGYQGSGAIDEIDVSIGGFEVTVDMNDLLPENVVVSDVASTNGYAFSVDDGVYTFAKGDTIRFTLAPAPGYRFKDGKAQAVYEFDMTDEVTVEFDNTEAEEDISTYLVQFFTNTVVYASTNVTGGTTVNAPDAPVAPAGQSFAGWFETNTLGQVVAEAFDFDNTAITNALDLFAQFTNTLYDITLTAGANGTIEATKSTGCTNGEVVVITASALEGYEFASESYEGWTKVNSTTLTKNYTVIDGENAVTAPDATKQAIIIYVAETGGTQYETLAAAVENAAAGATVTILTNIVLDTRVEPNKSLTINLAGWDISRTGTGGNGSVFDVKSGTVVITNGTITCTQDDSAIAADGVYAITARSGASVTLDALTITVNSECGACVYPFAGATVSILGGTYENLTTTPYRWHEGWTGMAVNQANGTSQLITITGGRFSKVDPALGDDSGSATTFLAAGYGTTLTDGYYVAGKATYKLTYVTEYGTAPAAVNYTMDTGNFKFAAAPTASGYTFQGWVIGTTTNEAGVAEFVVADHLANTTATAAWTAAGWDPNPETIPENTPAATKYPELAGTALATADAKKLTIWADNNSVAFSAAEEPTATLVEAYILNCAPTAEAVATEKAAFKATITMSGSTATVTLPIGKTYNVAPVMKGSNNLTSWTATEVTTGYQFFKFVLELPVAP